MAAAVTPGTVGLDAIINCDADVITVCLTNEPHLNVEVDFNVHEGRIMHLVGPYDTGSQVSFINYGVVRERAPHWLDGVRPFGFGVRGASPGI